MKVEVKLWVGDVAKMLNLTQAQINNWMSALDSNWKGRDNKWHTWGENEIATISLIKRLRMCGLTLTAALEIVKPMKDILDGKETNTGRV